MKQLIPEERAFLQGLLKQHLEYYRMLAGSPRCSPGNRQMAAFIETLHAKLNHAEILDPEN